MSTTGRSRRRSRAIAVLMVVLILAALVAIAAPFALSMGLHERKARSFRDTARARLAAEGAVAHAISVLRRTEDYVEETRRYGAPWNTPDFDTEEEFRVDFRFGGAGGGRLKDAGITFDDPRGVVWSVRVEDEQGKINILSAPREVLGGLIATGTLARDLAPGDRVILLDDASDFYTDGDSKTVDGSLKIGPERLSYALVEGDSLRGLRRNLNGLEKVPTHGAGRPVWAGEAEDIGEAARRGRLRTLHDLKRYLGPQQFERIEPYVTTHSYRESHSGWLRREEIVSDFGSLNRTVTVRDAGGLGPGTRVRFVIDTDVRERAYHVTRTRRAGERWKITFETQVGFDRPKDKSVFLEGEQRHPVNVNTAPPAVLKAVFAGVTPSRGRGFTREEVMALAQFVHDYVRGEVPGGKPVASEADIEVMFTAARERRILGDSFTHGRLEALVENATVGNSPNLRHSTLPFCFKSFGNFTIEAAAVVNTPAGEETARYVLRELVSLPVSSHGRRTLSSQKDFDEQMKRLVGRKIVTWPFLEPPTEDSDLKRYTQGLNPITGRDPYGTVRLATGRCPDDGHVDHFEPGKRVLQGSYELTHDGADLKGGTVWTAGSNVFETHNGQCRPVLLETWVKPDAASFTLFSAFKDPAELRNGLDLKYEKGRFVLRIADACVEQGAEKWNGPAEYTFQADEVTLGDWYHVAAQVTGTGPNDASLWIDGRPLVDTGALGAVEYGPGTRLEAPLLGRDSIAESQLNACDVVVANAADFPEDGAILVDGEVIEYASRGGAGFKSCRRARRYTNLADHGIGAVVVPYGYSVPLASDLAPGNATVASDLKGGTRPQTALPEEKTGNPNPPPDETYDLLDWDATTIPVQDADVFQSSGYAIICGYTNPEDNPDPEQSSERNNQRYSEFIFFGKADPNNGLQKVTRRHKFGESCDGRRMIVDSGPAREFLLDGRTTVTQISIAVNGFDVSAYGTHMENRDNSRRPPVGSKDYKYACITPAQGDDVEWIRLEYVDRGTDTGVQYLLGAYRQGGKPVFRARTDGSHAPMDAWRGQLGTAVLTDTVRGDSKLIPVFQVAGPQCGHHDSPRTLDPDRVTVMDSGGAEEDLKDITHAHCFEKWHRGNLLNVFRVSLHDSVMREFSSRSGRLLKFPSGEMPREVPGRLTVGALKGTLDEFRSKFFDLRPYRVARGSPVLATADEITVTREMAMNGANHAVSRQADEQPPPDCGVARIDDELVYYGQLQNAPKAEVAWGEAQRDKDKARSPLRNNAPGVTAWALTDCVRGILGTKRAKHSDGARVTFLQGLPVARVEDPGGEDKVEVTDATAFPEEGYAVNRPAVGGVGSGFYSGEIFGWTRKRGNTLEGVEYLRGRFGTKEADIRDGDLAQCLPFRYWSRHVPDRDGSELAFFQTSISARGARWRSVEWAEGLFGKLPVDGMELRVTCRFDGKPGWEARPSNLPGGLWEFKGAGCHKFSAGGGAPLVADSIDVRVYFAYRPHAWAEDSNEWKRTLALENLTVTFGSPLVVRKVDLLDY